VADLRRVINYPARGIGDKTMERATDFARESGLTLWQALERVEEAGVGSRAANAIEQFTFLINRYAAKAASAPAGELARELIQESGLLASLREENTVESLQRWENVQELISAIAEFSEQAPGDQTPTLSEFLQQVALVTDADASEGDPNRVTLMTLHASKGLEFKVVFVTGMEEGLFPLAAAAQDPTELEEERRLFYVGVTRAQELLFISYARSRYRFGEQQPGIRSRFLDEVKADDIIRTETGRPFVGKQDRFAVASGGTAAFDEMDPHYYRQSLRDEASRSQGPRRATQHRAESGERRVVYDEGAAEVVPGARVVHGTFGEGKVIALEGHGDRASATIFFPDVGQKKLKLKFARLQVVD